MESKKIRRDNVIDVLNQARSMELNAIHQYMNQHYSLDDKDYGELAANMKLIAIDEMRHAEQFAERIKELDGDPTVEKTGKIVKNQPVTEIYVFDAHTEDETIDSYNQFARVCYDNGDTISARLLESIIEEEQEHQSYFANIADHIADLGATYLSKIAGTDSSTGPSKGFTLTSND